MYNHSVIYLADLQLIAKTMRLKPPIDCILKEQKPRHGPNSQKCLLLTKEPA